MQETGFVRRSKNCMHKNPFLLLNLVTPAHSSRPRRGLLSFHRKGTQSSGRNNRRLQAQHHNGFHSDPGKKNDLPFRTPLLPSKPVYRPTSESCSLLRGPPHAHTSNSSCRRPTQEAIHVVAAENLDIGQALFYFVGVLCFRRCLS